ncbi:MAG: hypothetical protein A2293_02445, partial [Elusimicrobia bacterium RIFOXYB2_FULL_49_7]
SGTTVTVRELFHNTPARRKFLKSETSEQMKITGVMTAISAAHPSTAFRYIIDGKEKLNLPVALSTEGRLRQLFGADLANSLLFGEQEGETYQVRVHFSHLDYTRNNRSAQYFFVNHRPIESRALEQGIRLGYRDLLPPGRFPAAFVYIDINPDEIDVNVHPTKKEIRFSDDQTLMRAVARCITDGFRKLSVERRPASLENIPFSSGTILSDSSETKAAGQPSSLASESETVGLFDSTPVPSSGSLFRNRDETVSEMPRQHLLIPYFQIHNTYLLSQIKNGIILIDQHVAHERILYERALKNIAENEQPVTQQLLFPVTLELSPLQIDRFDAFEGHFGRTGFSLRRFSGTTVVVDGIPAGLKDCRVEQVVGDILGALEAPDPAAVHLRFARSFACHAALKAGTPLLIEEINALVDQLFQCENPYTCPHGRPIVIRIPLDEIARRFMR